LPVFTDIPNDCATHKILDIYCAMHYL